MALLVSFVLFLALISTISGKEGAAPKITLNDGNEIPALGFGTGGANRGNDTKEIVEAAIDAGYRFIDTAEWYKNEHLVGEAIENKIKEGVVKRKDMFVLTKLWNHNHKRELVVPALRASLEKLKMDYVDLYLIHFPMEILEDGSFGDTDYIETWKAFEECKNLGLAKSIGVSNFNQSQIERILKEGKIKPAALQVEVNVNFNQKDLIKFCKENNIQVIGFSPLGSIPEKKVKPDSPPPKIDDPVLTSIAEKYNKNTIQVVLRYLVDMGVVPIPKSSNPKYIQKNIDIFDFKLNEDEIRQMDSFNKNFRLIRLDFFKSHKYYPFW